MSYFGRLCALPALVTAVAATPACAATFHLGVFTASSNTVTRTGNLSTANPADNYLFISHINGKLAGRFANLTFTGAPGLAVSIYKYTGTFAPGVGTLLRRVGSSPATYTFVSAFGVGKYYALVTTNRPTTAIGSYSLSLIATGVPAPVPGPAALLVFGAGAAAMAARKRRASRQVLAA